MEPSKSDADKSYTEDEAEGSDSTETKTKSETKEEPAAKVSLRELFQYADKFDIFLIITGVLVSLGNGATQPVMTIIFADMIGTFTDYTIGTINGKNDAAAARFDEGITLYVVYFCTLAAYSFIVSYLQMLTWMVSGERQSKRIRELYYKALLSQEIAWFDVHSSGDLISRLSSDVSLIQEGLSEKMGMVFQGYATFISGFVIAFVKGWRLALVLLSAVPLMGIAGLVMSKVMQSRSESGQDAYAQAGHVAEEVLSSIRTVTAFGGQEKELKRYNEKLNLALRDGARKGLIGGLGFGCVMLIMFSTYALAFWYGSRQIADGLMSAAEVLNVFFAIMIGAMSLGIVAPSFASIGTAQGAAAKIYAVIQRDSQIDPFSSEGTKIDSLQGRIEFKNIFFQYPTRKTQILNNFNLKIPSGQTVAFVGTSGCGKSTLISLLERFYTIDSGQILIDDVDIATMNVSWLRKQIGVVSQEPILFGVSIFQNIVWGAETDQEELWPTQEQVEDACRRANIHDFISQLPEGYNTLVGERGALLSGGQKQRIAIARALIKDPRILILDEATSALDTESERVVQAALDKVMHNRTTIVIAHRLSTIMKADLIVVLKKGEIIEMGNHTELVKIENGFYAQMVNMQDIGGHQRRQHRRKSRRQSSGIDEAVQNNLKEEIEQLEQLKKSKLEKTPTQKEKEEEEAANEARLLEKGVPWGKVIKLNMPEKWLVLLGILGSVVNGLIFPMFAIVFTQILSVFAQVDKPEKMKKDADFWALMFVALGVVSLIAIFCQQGVFAVSGERLTRRLRYMSFEAMLRQEIAFFDNPKHGTGALTSKLATEAEQIRGLSGVVVGVIIQAASGLLAGMIIAFVYGWKLTLVVLACVPVIGLAQTLHMKHLTGYSAKTKKAFEEAVQLATETIENVRTVAVLGRNYSFYALYRRDLKGPHMVALRGAVVSAIGYGSSQAMIFLVYSVAFYYGSRLILSGEYTVDQMLMILFSVVFSAVAVGNSSSYMPNVAKAKIAAIDLFEIIDRPSKIDPGDPKGISQDVRGQIAGSKISFAYPGRKDIPILVGMDFEAAVGKRIALVGTSGSGKSTIIGLTERFYDVDGGKVEVDGVDVREWRLQSLRNGMSLVGQEPVLFDISIADNIAYGIANAPQELIEEAAKAANIHTFISGLPDGYKTRVGEKGVQLSGGQKQRVAIARALIRNPRVLLLDEATSALDAESERVVQDALDRAMEARTTIVVAHRLSTIQNADMIIVMRTGKVVERGTHHELLALHGVYYELVQRQSLK